MLPLRHELVGDDFCRIVQRFHVRSRRALVNPVAGISAFAVTDDATFRGSTIARVFGIEVSTNIEVVLDYLARLTVSFLVTILRAWNVEVVRCGKTPTCHRGHSLLDGRG